MARVLVVDDDPHVLSCCAQFLKAGGHEVVRERSAIAAILTVSLASPPFDLVITDYEMPRMNGLELIEEIRKAGLKMPIIMMTGNPNVPENHGADALLIKPMGLVVLLARVDNLLKAKS